MLPIPADKLLNKLIRRGFAGEHCTRLVIDIDLSQKFVKVYTADKGHVSLGELPELMTALEGYKDVTPGKKPKVQNQDKNKK